VIEDDAARRAEEARRAAIAEQQQRIDALTAQVAEAERLAEEAQEAARQEFAAEHERLSAELEAERERARVIEDDAAHLAEAAREAALAEQQIARLTAQLDEAAAQVERAREQARAQLAGMLAGMSAKIADIEQAAHHEHEEALAERQEQIETLEARLRDAEERAAQARLLAREEYEGEIATSLAEAAAVEERIAQAKAEAQEQYQAEIDRLAQELDAAINGAGEDGVRLAESLGFLQSLLDGIPYPVFFTDRDGRYQSCNTAFARRIVGMPRQDLLGLSFDDLRGRIPGELMEALRRGERDVLTEGVEEAYEVRVPISGGQQRTFAFRKEPCLDHEGQIVGVIGAMLDLSGLEEAQQSLEEERQHCATVLERVPAVVAEIKPDGRTVAVHGDCWKLLGYEREQLIGRDWWETLFPGHLQEPIRDVVGAMRSGADLDDRALVMRTADGEERTLSWTTSNARNDRRELVSILAVAVDITERAETEEALQLSYREALERIKKLRCLGNVLRLTQDESLSLVEVISGIATSLPEAWGYPGITTSRISVYKRERRGGESPYPVVAFQSAPIMVSGEKVGEVQVCYHEDRPERFDGPFTADERELLDVIARRISEMIERRSAEESLAKLRLFRHNLIEQANLWVMALDRDRNVVLWNRVAEEISGYSRGEVVGHDRVWELLYPDRGYRTEIIHGMTEVTFGAHIAEDWETIIRARDGTDRVISWHANRLMDDDGTTLGSVVFGRETSQRRAAASS
jgi:PAS domain S-box-containing protein